MTVIEIAASILGRQFKILTITKKELIMEQKLVKIKITNAVGIGYAKGKVYQVTEDEAKKLISQQKAVPVLDDEKETATAKAPAKEKRG